MDDREFAELAALTGVLNYLITKREPSPDDIDDPKWRTIFEDAYYLARRCGASYARNHRD